MFRPGSNAINLGQPVNRFASLNRGLIGWWMSLPGGPRGLIGLDLCGRYHGALEGGAGGAIWASAAGRPGGWGGVYADGFNSQSLSVPSNTGYKPTGEVTISAWFYGASTTATECGAGWLGASGSPGRGCLLGVNNSTGAVFYVPGTLSSLTSASASVHTSTAWWHYVGTYVPSTSVTLYQNGLQVNQNTSSIPASLANNNGLPLQIGSRGDYAGLFLGTIDDVRIYGRALSADEVMQLFNASRTGYAGELNRINRPVAVKKSTATFKAAWARYANQVISIPGAA